MTSSLDIPHAEPRLAKPKFAGLALVCCECEERSNGPTRLKSRQVRKLFKSELHAAPQRLRVVQCTCLGLCPKKAIAACVMAGGAAPMAVEMRNEDEAEAAAIAFVRALQAR